MPSLLPMDLHNNIPLNDDQLIGFLLQLADDALILGHRNSEWCGHGPVLEQDIAITNISLDLIGQARNFYQYAASLIGNGATEDSLAYLRDASAFCNHVLVEQPRGDWAFTIARQLLFSQYQYLLYHELKDSADEQLAAIAAKSLKEITYHLRWSSEWLIRLGDGTALSHEKMKNAVAGAWLYTGELFNIPLVDPHTWMERLLPVFDEATLELPAAPEILVTNSVDRPGQPVLRHHSRHLTDLLTDMQSLHREHPGVEW